MSCRVLSTSLQGAVRAAEDNEQRFGLPHRFHCILGWFSEERALADEHLHREAVGLADEDTSEVAERPERSDENSRRGVAVFVVHVGDAASIGVFRPIVTT
jgi:hypothetical protein